MEFAHSLCDSWRFPPDAPVSSLILKMWVGRLIGHCKLLLMWGVDGNIGHTNHGGISINHQHGFGGPVFTLYESATLLDTF